jgi:hypothetical protein
VCPGNFKTSGSVSAAKAGPAENTKVSATAINDFKSNFIISLESQALSQFVSIDKERTTEIHY